MVDASLCVRKQAGGQGYAIIHTRLMTAGLPGGCRSGQPVSATSWVAHFFDVCSSVFNSYLSFSVGCCRILTEEVLDFARPSPFELDRQRMALALEGGGQLAPDGDQLFQIGFVNRDIGDHVGRKVGHRRG